MGNVLLKGMAGNVGKHASIENLFFHRVPCHGIPHASTGQCAFCTWTTARWTVGRGIATDLAGGTGRGSNRAAKQQRIRGCGQR